MLRTLQILALLLLSSPCWATFTVVQSRDNAACSSTASCTVTITTTAGHVLVAALVADVNIQITSVTNGGTWTHCSNCANGSAATGYVDMAYTLASSSATSIIINHTALSNNSIALVWEYSYSASSVAFDASGNSLIPSTSPCTSCAGTALTLSGTSDAISTVAGCGGACSAITTYSADFAFVSGDAYAHLINTSSGAAPSITQTSGGIATTALAIKEVTSGGTNPTPPLFVIQP